MTYAVMSEFNKKHLNTKETTYTSVAFFDDKGVAEEYAKRHAAKQSGVPEELVFELTGTTKTAIPVNVEIVATT